MESFELVRNVLKKEGIRQVDLADRLDTTQSNISAALTGKNETTLNKIVVILVDEYGYERTYFFPSADERLTQIEESVKRIEGQLERIIRALKGGAR